MMTSRSMVFPIADQVVWTASNVLLNVLIARSVSDVDFGRFSVGYLLVTISITMVVAATIETLNANESIRADLRKLFWLAMPLSRSAILLSTIFALAVGFLLLRSEGYLLASIVVFALPVFIAQESGRSIGISMGSYKSVLLADALWIGVQIVGFLLLRIVWPDEVAAVASWTVGAVLSAAALWFSLLKLAGERKEVTDGLFSLRDGLLNAGDYLLAGGSTLLVTLLVGTLASASELAQVRTLQIAFGPVNMVIAAMRLAGVRFVKENPLTSGVFGVTMIAWGATALFLALVPDNVGQLAFGDSWATATWIFVAVTLARLGAVLMVWPALRLRMLGYFSEVAKIRTAGLLATMLIAVASWIILGTTALLLVALAGVTIFPAVGAWRTALKVKGAKA